MNSNLQFYTIGKQFEVCQLATILLVSDRLIANQLTEIFPANRLTGNIPTLNSDYIIC